MEIIKRKILLEDIISRKPDGTYGTMVGDDFYIKIFLTQKYDDMGAFSSFDNTEFPLTGGTLYDFEVSGETIMRYVNDDISRYETPEYKISGLTEDRLYDVRNYDEDALYKHNFDIKREQYTDYQGNVIDGVDRVTSLGVNYIDYVVDAVDNANIGTINQENGFCFNIQKL